MRATARLTIPVLLLCALIGSAAAQEPRLGTIDFPTSGSAAAQEHFIRGVLFLHSFEYASAAAAFQEAQRLDRDFAMAYWGEAMTYTHPVWNQQDLERARSTLQRLAPTPEARRAKAPTEREKDYLEAIEVLYGSGDKAERDTAYSLAMKDLMDAHPEDMEARTFYALSLLGLSQGVRDVSTYMRAAAAAQEVFWRNPQHPGAAHYLIHSFDDPVHAPLGLPAARAYSGIAPDAPHAQHMTTHIFVALGMWDDVVSQNEIATGDRWLPHHYSAWLAYGLLQQGRYDDALELLERVRTNMYAGDAEPPLRQRSYLSDMRAHYIINAAAWVSPILDWEIELDDASAETTARDLFTAGYAALRRADRASAEADLKRMAVIDADVEYAEEAAVPNILERELRAALLLDAGEGNAAVALMMEATAAEDAMPVAFGPPVLVKPAHEMLGELLLELDRPAEARREFERALQLAPKRATSLLGLARAASAAGDERTAARAYETLCEIWHRADRDVQALSHGPGATGREH